MKSMKAAVIGSGNIAHHFVPALLKLEGIFISCLLSRNEDKGMVLCRNNKIAFGKSLASIPDDVDIVYIMTSDDSIKPLSQELTQHISPSVAIVHFSGSCNLSEIDPYFSNVANAWPLQSISETDDSLELTDVPICISASTDELLYETKAIFASISDRVIQVDARAKSTLHVAAVIANNFTNHLLHLSQELLLSEELDFELLKPLIHHTLEKVMSNDPKDVQTGPAIRNDEVAISKHLALLESRPELSEIYTTLTNSIKKTK